MVDDYLERHEDAFDEFDNPDDIYSDLVEQLDGLEVRRPAHAAPAALPTGTRLDASTERASASAGAGAAAGDGGDAHQGQGPQGQGAGQGEGARARARGRQRREAAARGAAGPAVRPPICDALVPVMQSAVEWAPGSGLARARSVILEDDTSPEKQEKAPRKSTDQARAGKDPPTPTGRGPAAAALPLPLRTDAAPLAEAAAGARGVLGYPGSPVSAMSDVRPRPSQQRLPRPALRLLAG